MLKTEEPLLADSPSRSEGGHSALVRRELEEENARLRRSVDELSNSVRAREASEARAREEASQIRSELNATREQLSSVLGSIKWKIVYRIGKVAARALPEGSRRKNTVKGAIVKAFGVIRKAGRIAARSKQRIVEVVEDGGLVEERWVRFLGFCRVSPLRRLRFGWDGDMSRQGIIRLVPEAPIEFQFSPPAGDLEELLLLMVSAAGSLRFTVEINLSVIDGDGSPRLLRTVRAEVPPGSTDYVQFRFDPITVLPGSQYLVSVVSIGGAPRDSLALVGSPAVPGASVPQEYRECSHIDTVRADVHSNGEGDFPRDDRFLPRYLCESRVEDSFIESRFGWNGHEYQIPHPLDATSRIVWSLHPSVDVVAAVEIQFATYGRANRCTVELEIMVDGKRVRHCTVPSEDVRDNQYYRFLFEPITGVLGKKVTFALYSKDSCYGNCIAVWGTVQRAISGDVRGVAEYVLANDRVDPREPIDFFCRGHNLKPFESNLTPRELSPELCRSGHVLLVIHPSAVGSDLVRRLVDSFGGMGRTSITLTDNLSFTYQSLDTVSAVCLVDLPMDRSLRYFVRVVRHSGRPVLYAVSEVPDTTSSITTYHDQRRVRDLSRMKRLTARSADGVISFSRDTGGSFRGIRGELQLLSETYSAQNALASIRQELSVARLPSFTIVAVLYGKEKEVPHFLQSFGRQSYRGKVELLFVDDCSPDGGVALVERFSAPNLTVRVLKNQKNIGNCGSRNRAIAEATGDIIIVIDADCVVSSTFLEEHAAAHRIGDIDVVIGPLNLETHGRNPTEVLVDYEAHPEKVRADADLQDRMYPPSFLNCITRNISLSRRFVSTLGEPLFDEAFSYSKNPESGFGWEDVEMGYRLYSRGARIRFIDRAFSVHVSHEAAVDNTTKPLRSLKNFRRLIQKHPSIVKVGRRWVFDTFQKICAWSESLGNPVNEDRIHVEEALRPYVPYRYTSAGRKLRILSYRWHCPHQYELYKLGHDFTLATDLGVGMCQNWDFDQRPLRENAVLRSINSVDLSDFDLVILHFDENVLDFGNTNGVIGEDWGRAFRWLRENVNVPKVAICHGTPQFYGQYNPNYVGVDLGKTIESARGRLVEYLQDIPVVCNSHQAEREWRFKKSCVIWQGFDPAELPLTTFSRGILSMGHSMAERIHYRGYNVFKRVFEDFPEIYRPESLCVPDPDVEYDYNTNQYAWAKYRNYVNAIREYSIYFNPTLRSPMPRSRGEAMMCGLATVSVNNHDVEMFIKNGVNGFYSADPLELREFLLYLSENPSDARSIGCKGRETALDLFNHDHYLARWQALLREVVGAV